MNSYPRKTEAELKALAEPVADEYYYRRYVADLIGKGYNARDIAATLAQQNYPFPGNDHCSQCHVRRLANANPS
jgi:hypothetical protein